MMKSQVSEKQAKALPENSKTLFNSLLSILSIPLKKMRVSQDLCLEDLSQKNQATIQVKELSLKALEEFDVELKRENEPKTPSHPRSVEVNEKAKEVEEKEEMELTEAKEEGNQAPLTALDFNKARSPFKQGRRPRRQKFAKENNCLKNSVCYAKGNKQVNGWWKPRPMEDETQEAYQLRLKNQKKIDGFSALLN